MTEDNIAEIIKALKPIKPSTIGEVKEFIGQKFGKLTILEIPGRDEKRKCIMAKCYCECGNFTITALSDIKRNHTTSCGCMMASRRNIHGEASSIGRKARSEYAAWTRIKCKTNRANKDKVDGDPIFEISCERWLDKAKGYTNFLEDMGRRQQKAQLRRRDNTKMYDKDNCYWSITK